MELSDKSKRVLEFDKILEKLSGYTDNEDVKKRIYELDAATDLGDAKARQHETTEGVVTSLKLGTPPVSLSVKNVTGSARRAEQGGVLSPAELTDVSRLLYVARRMKSYLSETADECTFLQEKQEELLTAKQLEERINLCIIGEGEIADEASSELSSIRRRMRTLNGKIKENINNMIRSAYYKKMLQDSIVTMRNGRYVIPVKSEYKSEIPGIVHDTSSSGATLFIEPMTAVSTNNEIRDLINKEEREIERILSELSANVSENSHEIFVDYRIITELDFIFCKAKLSLDINAYEPNLNDRGIIKFKAARHPLIDKEKVVSNDIYLGGDFDTLVVTGPNTGGKTVTLKTVGLFSLMAAAGLHIPARDGSDAAVFSAVYADIGDEQSIEQSLSTFSSHMVNIVKITNDAKPGSLVLFDELGAGTDPVEGAALAISVLEHLRAKGVFTVSTTHYSELKLFALSTDGVENASCEFNVETLKPTYKLLIGVPGKSNAFAISKRLGLDEDIIGRANELLSDENVKFEDIVTDLEENRAKAERDMNEARRMKAEIKELRKALEQDRIKLKENKGRILEDARREAKIIVMDAKDEANKIIKDLEKLQREKNSADISEKAGNAREKLKKKEESIDAQLQKVKKPKKVYAAPPKNLKPGTPVRILDMNNLEATVLKEPGSDGMVRIQAGIMKMDVHVTNLRLADGNETNALKEKYTSSVRSFDSKTKSVSTQIDVRGQTLEEAYMSVGKFIDDCYLASVSPVTIIHGKGTGVLKKGIQEMLKKNKYVKSYRPGRYGEGEDGVTVAELK